MNTGIRKFIGVFALSMAGVTVSLTPAAAEGTWRNTLQGRDLDGSLATIEAYFDTALNITWLADTNYAKTSGYDADGLMTWSDANAWAASLSLGGYTNWRLPKVNPIDGTTSNDANISKIGTEDWGYNISAPGTKYSGSAASEMAHLFYITLGDMSVCDPRSSTVSSCVFPNDRTLSAGPFSIYLENNSYYWSATGYAPNNSFDAAWVFFFNDGLQLIYPKEKEYYAWAVHSGDVGVPTDTDGDQVETGEDMCPNTPTGKVVDPGSGCSLEESVPCAGPLGSGQPWSDHSQFVMEFSNTVTRFVNLHLINSAEYGTLVSAAETSDCGK